jgi:photosystem II stability/assembly factor-like uncharacterized protein
VTFLSDRYIRGAAALLLLAAPLAAQRWRTQYFYDEDKTTLQFVDMQFPSAARGVAVGVVTEEQGKRKKSVAMVTSDGGAHWQTVDLPDVPVSLYFLNEGLGWLVTGKGNLWETTEAGKNWHKLPKPPGETLRVHFTTENDGWAAGTKKRVFQTHDGGKHWTAVPAAAEPPGEADYSLYSCIAFATPQFGIISGFNLPPRRTPQMLPDWLDPEKAMSRRDTPHLSYSLTTHDGGKTWKADSASLFGEVERIRLAPGGTGMGLISYSNAFRYPSEVYRIDWHTGRSATVYRDHQFDISDVWVGADGTAYLAGTKVAGQMREVMPGKVQVLESRDWTNWKQMPVDYRANATRVMLAGSGGSLWMATDEGMILKLEQ